MRRRMRALGLLATMSLVPVACGDDDDGAADETVSEGAATTAAEGGATTTAGEGTATTEAEGGATTTAGEATATTAGEGGGAGECTEADAGGELTFARRNEAPGLDPLVSGTVGALSGAERTAIFDTLTVYNPETQAFEPRMAESLEPNEDFTEWTMTLRDGITFGSGAPLDTAAVQFSIERHRAPDSTSLSRALASSIESMDIVDDLTMVFHMTGPYGNFPSLLAGAVGMPIDPAVFEELGPEAFAADPQGGGAGPFRLASWAPSEEMVLEAKDDYWDGPVCIDTLRFVRIETNDAIYDAFANGEVDAAFIRSAPELAKAREDEANLFPNMSNDGFTLIINNGAFGTERPASDLRIRQAIAYALDPEIIDERALGGQGVPGSALVPESSILFTDAIEGTPYDPDQARQLLEEVKAETGYDGSLFFLCNTTYAEAALAIEGLLEAVGFVVENDSSRSIQDWVGYMATTNNDYDLTCSALSMTDAQPWETLNELIQGENGFMGYVNPEMDAAMTELRAASTVEEQQAALTQIQQVWNDTVPSVVYGHVEEGVVWNDNVENIQFTLETITLFDEVTVS